MKVLALLLSIVASFVSLARAAEPQERTSDATPASDGTSGWREALPPDRFFRILIPGPFQTFDDSAEVDGLKGETKGVRATLPGAFGGSNTYVASCVTAKGDDRTTKQRLQASIDQWEKLTALHWRKPLEQGGVPGVEFQLADDIKVIRVRSWAPAGRTCTILMHWRPFSKPPDADIAKFFDSFTFTKQ